MKKLITYLLIIFIAFCNVVYSQNKTHYEVDYKQNCFYNNKKLYDENKNKSLDNTYQYLKAAIDCYYDENQMYDLPINYLDMEKTLTVYLQNSNNHIEYNKYMKHLIKNLSRKIDDWAECINQALLYIDYLKNNNNQQTELQNQYTFLRSVLWNKNKKDIQNYTQLYIDANNELGNMYLNNNYIDSALAYFEENLELITKENNSNQSNINLNFFNAYCGIGNCYYKSGIDEQENLLQNPYAKGYLRQALGFYGQAMQYNNNFDKAQQIQSNVNVINMILTPKIIEIEEDEE